MTKRELATTGQRRRSTSAFSRDAGVIFVRSAVRSRRQFALRIIVGEGRRTGTRVLGEIGGGGREEDNLGESNRIAYYVAIGPETRGGRY